MQGTIFSKTYCSILIAILVFICLITLGIYFYIIWNNKALDILLEAPVQIVDSNVNHTNMFRHVKEEGLAWPLAIVSSVSICAITFIIGKIISANRDLIDNEQIKQKNNNT